MSSDLKSLRRLLPPGSRVLCAVSGGADSLCLLELLRENRESLGIELTAAHYEHGIRGEESLADAAFVEAFCRERDLPLVLEHGDVPAWAKEHGLGLEEAARERRYEFLERTADRLGCDKIAVAHNADDNAETMLLNLVRGGGAAGLAGIPPVRGRIVRPLLEVPRSEIEEWLGQRGLSYRQDSSNLSDEYSRNLLRHRVLPVLRELNPAFAAAAGRTARLLREDESCLTDLAERFIEAHFDGESLPIEELRALPWSLSSRVLRRLCPKSLSLEHVRAVLRLTEGTELAYADVPGLRVRRERGRLYFREPEAVPPLPERTLLPGQSLEIPERGLRLRAETAVFGGEIHDLFKTCCFKYERIYGNIKCTGPRPGDKMRPLGRGCTKSLKSLFAEAGLTKARREAALVLRDDKGILAVPGLAADERTAPSPGDRVLMIEIEKN